MRDVMMERDVLTVAKYLHNDEIEGHSILITGSTGLIGSIIVKGIIRHNELYKNKIYAIAIAREKEKVKKIYSEFLKSSAFMDIRFIYQDINNEVRYSGTCDYIVHAASPTASKMFITHPVEVMKSVFSGTQNILDFAIRSGIRGMVYLSSMEVFGVVSEAERLSEEKIGYLDIHSVRSCYSEGKRAAECLCNAYAFEYHLPVKIARLAQTFGAGISISENRVFSQFAKSAIKGEDIILHTSGDSVGNYCYTTDAINAILILLTKGENGAAYTVANEDMTMKIKDVALFVAEQFSNGQSSVTFDIPESNCFGYAPITKMRLSSEKLRQLGWTPQYGLRESYESLISTLKIQIEL